MTSQRGHRDSRVLSARDIVNRVHPTGIFKYIYVQWVITILNKHNSGTVLQTLKSKREFFSIKAQ